MENWIHDVIVVFGYVGLVAILVIEHVFPPIPSEIVLPLAGFLANRGVMSLWGATIAATLGSVIGATILYGLGRWGGRGLVLRYGHIFRIDQDALARAERWFARWGDWVVLGGRIVPLGRSVVSVPAGTMRIPLVRFWLLTALGSAVWNVVLIGAGWLLGENWEVVAALVDRYSMVVLVFGAVTLAVLGCGMFYRSRRQRACLRRERSERA